MHERNQTRLFITGGAGQPLEVAGDAVADFDGTVLENVRRILAEHGNREAGHNLTALSQDPHLIMEVFGPGSGGQLQEAPLSPSADWSTIRERLRLGDVELGLARRHIGGVIADDGEEEADYVGPSAQELRRHPADYRLTPADIAAVCEGQALFFTGSVLAKAHHLCLRADTTEIIWYFVAADSEPYLLIDLIVPEQDVSSGSCAASARGVLRANRLARSRRQVIKAAGHSHGQLRVFTSVTDDDLMQDLWREGVGYASANTRRLTGAVTVVRAADGRQHLTVQFKDHPALRLDLTVPEGVTADQVGACVSWPEQSRLTTCFSTHNSSGDRIFPVQIGVSCPSCGQRIRRAVTREALVHVVGPETISRAERAELDAMFEEHVRLGWGRRTDDERTAPCSNDAGASRSTDN